MKNQPEESRNLAFPYEIIKSKRKTLSIIIKSGKVEVRSPLNAPAEWVHDFIRQKSGWVMRQLAEQQVRMAQRLVIAEGREVCFFGLPRQVRVVLAGGRSRIELNDEHLYIFTRENTPEKLERIFHRWLQEQAREYLTPRSIATARRLGVEDRLKEVVFRKTRSKWGHCCRDGTLQYNWLVMMAPREVCDYLVAHECSHLLHMNHSARFWHTVESICPDYRRLRHWLRENGHRLWTEY